jgi:ribose transport system permease protein
MGLKGMKIDVKEYGIIVFFLMLMIGLSFVAKGFSSPENLINVSRQVSLVGIIAVGMTLVMISGGIDLSIGSIMAASGVASAYLMTEYGFSPILAGGVGVVLGGLVGLLNGFLIATINIPPFIATLATMAGARGLAYVITQGMPIYGFPDEFSLIGQDYFLFIPLPVWIMLLTFVAGIILLNLTPFGKHVYGVGGNEEAARLSGVNVARVKLWVYVINGLLSGLAGIVLLSRIMTAVPNAGNGFEMDVITAVVLGGVSMAGGEGKLRGVFIGVLTMGVLSNGMMILGFVEYYQWIVRCFVLIIAVGFDRNIELLSAMMPKKYAVKRQ